MKNLNIFEVHCKIWFLGRGVTKNQYRSGGLPKKRGGGVWTVCRFKWGLARERGVVFLRGVILQCTLWGLTKPSGVLLTRILHQFSYIALTHQATLFRNMCMCKCVGRVGPFSKRLVKMVVRDFHKVNRWLMEVVQILFLS